MAPHSVRRHKFDEIAFGFISFVSMQLHRLLFSYNFLPLRQIPKINIFINNLEYDKMKINLKLNEIKLIPHQYKRLLN